MRKLWQDKIERTQIIIFSGLSLIFHFLFEFPSLSITITASPSTTQLRFSTKFDLTRKKRSKPKSKSCPAIASQTSHILGVIGRSFKYRDSHLPRTLFKCLPLSNCKYKEFQTSPSLHFPSHSKHFHCRTTFLEVNIQWDNLLWCSSMSLIVIIGWGTSVMG